MVNRFESCVVLDGNQPTGIAYGKAVSALGNGFFMPKNCAAGRGKDKTAMYLTEIEYEQYGGTLEAIGQYDALEYRARRMIDRMTFFRIRDETPAREAVKRLMVELIDILHGERSALDACGRGVTAMSNDGVSVNYSDMATLSAQTNARCRDLICAYLDGETDAKGVPLLYRGIPL